MPPSLPTLAEPRLGWLGFAGPKLQGIAFVLPGRLLSKETILEYSWLVNLLWFYTHSPRQDFLFLRDSRVYNTAGRFVLSVYVWIGRSWTSIFTLWSNSDQSLLFAKSLFKCIFKDIALEQLLSLLVCLFICNKLCLHCGNNLSFVGKFWDPVFFVEQAFELVHRHAKLRLRLKKFAQMIHQRRVFLLRGNLFARLDHHVIECLGLIDLLLHKNEEILWNLNCVFFNKSFQFRVGWYFIQWTVGKVISGLDSWKLSFVTDYQVSFFVQETNSRDWLCKFDFSNQLSSEVPNFDKPVLVTRNNKLQVAMKINRRYFFIMFH